MLFGEIKEFLFRLPGKMRFRLIIDDDQFIREPTVFIKPKSQLLRISTLEDGSEGLVIMSRGYGLVILQRRIVTPGHFVPVIDPARSDRKPFIPLGELLTLTS